MKKYYIAGFINLHAVFPAFVYPVFADQSNPECYYLEDGFGKTIKSFREIEADSLPPIYKNKSLLLEIYSVGAQTVYAFMKDPTDVVYGNIDFLVHFLLDYRRTISDKLLSDEINTFLSDCLVLQYKAACEQRLLPEYSPLKFPVHQSSDMLNKDEIIFHYCDSLDKLFFASFEKKLDFQYTNALNLLLMTNQVYDEYLEVEALYRKKRDAVVSYERLLAENRALVDSFLRLSDTYASLILCDVCNNEDSTDRFIERMLLKKTWLLSDDELRHFYARYLENFKNMISMEDFIFLSYSESENLLWQLQIENKALRKLISFLIDVLEDRGVYSPKMIPFDACR